MLKVCIQMHSTCRAYSGMRSKTATKHKIKSVKMHVKYNSNNNRSLHDGFYEAGAVQMLYDGLWGEG